MSWTSSPVCKVIRVAIILSLVAFVLVLLIVVLKLRRKSLNIQTTEKPTEYTKGYGYRLSTAQHIQTPHRPPMDVVWEGCRLRTDGMLTARRGFSWDGRSGIWRRDKTKTASLYHDIAYMMLRNGLLPPEEKPVADRHYKNMLIERGVWPLYARFDGWVLSILGWRAAFKKRTIHRAP